MAPLIFEWDKEKSISNQRNHGISFQEAQTVFVDEHALLIPDPDHSNQEDRFILLGMSVTLSVLVVCHCYRKNDQIIRIISARRATRTERELYGERWQR